MNRPHAWSVRTADYILQNASPEGYHPRLEKKWAYVTGMTLKAFERVWELTGDAKYFDFIKLNMSRHIHADGTIEQYVLEDYNLDNINQGKLLYLMLRQTGDPCFEKAINLLADQLKGQPRTSDGGFWHKKRYPFQMWLDGLYMASPFMAEYALVFDRPEWFDVTAHQLLTVERHTRDRNSGLLYHGWDETCEQAWANPSTGKSPHFWSRAMGWYAMALADTLEYFPRDHAMRGQLCGIFERMAGALVKVQDKESGLWYQVLDQGGRKGNYLEASSSGMFIYALAKGVRLHYLTKGFASAAKRGYEGMLDRLIELDDEGGVHLTKICAGAGLGGDPRRDGSYEYYLSEPVVQDSMMGVAPFILASTEIERMDNQS